VITHSGTHLRPPVRPRAGRRRQPDLLAGDAAYTPRQYADPDTDAQLPPGQASDLPSWRDCVRRMRAAAPARVHFCHHTDIVHG
jgi:hypothetical protein